MECVLGGECQFPDECFGTDLEEDNNDDDE